MSVNGCLFRPMYHSVVVRWFATVSVMIPPFAATRAIPFRVPPWAPASAVVVLLLGPDGDGLRRSVLRNLHVHHVVVGGGSVVGLGHRSPFRTAAVCCPP